MPRKVTGEEPCTITFDLKVAGPTGVQALDNFLSDLRKGGKIKHARRHRGYKNENKTAFSIEFENKADALNAALFW